MKSSKLVEMYKDGNIVIPLFIFKAIINRNLIVIDRVEFPNKMF